MPQSESLELRVLTGVQSGARARLNKDCTTIGHGVDADILIFGLGVEEPAAQLELLNDGVAVSFCESDGEVGPRHTLALGELFRLGKVDLCVSRIQDPWSSPEPVEVLIGANAAIPAPASLRPTTPLLRASGRRAWLLACLALTAAGACANMLSPYWPLAATFMAPAAAAESPNNPLELQSAIEELGLQDRLKIARIDGVDKLRGSVADDAALLALRGRVSTTQWRGTTDEVVSDETLARQLRALLEAREMPLFATGVERAIATVIEAAPAAASASAIAEIKSHINELDSVQSIEYSLASGANIMRDELAHAGFSSQMKVEVLNGKVRVSSDASPPQEDLEKFLIAFNRRTKGLIPFVVQMGQGTQGSLPFGITQVVRSAFPYVVADNGHRLYVGDGYRGYRLVAIRSAKLMFQGPWNVELDL